MTFVTIALLDLVILYQNRTLPMEPCKTIYSFWKPIYLFNITHFNIFYISVANKCNEGQIVSTMMPFANKYAQEV